MTLGDQNTEFFHKSLIHRQVKNRVISLRDESRAIISDQQDLGRMVVRFYQGLFSALTRPPIRDALRYFTRCIAIGMRDY